MDKMSRNFGIFTIALMVVFSINSCHNLVVPSPTAIPTITSVSADTKVCQGALQASTPIVVRPDGIGGTDNNEGGRFAAFPKAASTSEGILVSWQTGINGQYPEPNVYMRLLDDDAQPIGDMNLPFKRNMVAHPNFVSKDDGALLTFCGLYDNGAIYVTSVLLDPYGKFISEQHRFLSKEFYCGYPEPDAIWTGSRLLFAWSSQSYGQNGKDTNLTLDIADANGYSLAEIILRPDAMLAPHFAFGHGIILLVIPTRTGADFPAYNNRGQTHLAIHRFDSDGAEISEPVILEPEEGIGLEFGASFLVPTSEGWLLLASLRRGTYYYVAHLSPDGSLVSGPELMDAGTDIVFLDVVPYGGGAIALTDWQDAVEISKIFFLTEDGIIKYEWHPNEDEFMGLGGLVVHRGRLFVVYTGKFNGNSVSNEVLIRELQCAP